MKSFLKVIIIFLLVSSLVSCDDKKGNLNDTNTDINNEEDGETLEFIMKAELLSIGEKLEVNITEAEYASGIFHIIISDVTEIYDASGTKIERSDLSVGSILTISYSGQIMMSYPPQTVARKIYVN